jgi:hypothetical protein
VTGFLISIVPTAGVLFMFWVALRALIQADRRERAATARLEAEQRARVPVTKGGAKARATGETVTQGPTDATGYRSGTPSLQPPAADAPAPAADATTPAADATTPAASDPGRRTGNGSDAGSEARSEPGDEGR